MPDRRVFSPFTTPFSDLAVVAADECRELFAAVVGPGDPLWPLHIEVTRQVLAADGIPAGELTEWLAVALHSAGRVDNGS